MPTQSLSSILYIEDDEALARLLQKRMERLGFVVTLAPDGETGLACLATHTYDVVLVDYNLPGMSGIELLDALKETANAPPTILLTAGGDERVAVKALELGAADYAVKDPGQTYLDLLPSIMQSAFTKLRLQRELEKAKARAEAANEAKGNFLATMSHEIRTPMNVVSGIARALGRTSLNGQQQELVDTLQTNANILLRMINDLLDISKIESGRVTLENQPFMLSSIMENMRVMFAATLAEKGLTFDISSHVDDGAYLGDRTRIEQILMNLISNAAKFTERGSITVTATAEHAERLTISVADTGIGIAQDKLPTIFDSFTQADETITRRFGGSGLGLSIARELAHMMDGDITVQTSEGRGSCFSLVIPLVRSDQPANVPQAEATPSAASAEVLIVEDYAPNILVASLVLEELGYTAASASSGPEALAMIAQRTAPFHAILMDVQMHGMDGLDTTRKLRALEQEKGFRHYIIGLTAHALAGDRERCLDAGMDDYASKPIQPDILAAILARAS